MFVNDRGRGAVLRKGLQQLRHFGADIFDCH